ncbi:ABC transporter substrate-binding protein [Acidihalobacter yilgarnensis]|uniref:ABC transporter substrate-binding protein n=1 Tax=Acidihalobacter yilgarnensis TaxID=2819280 RepID=A0A1D8IL99_9GAMM|nr:extracellular solute-binding protein [Acidihalobacter yilgarnensis]AOU97244.1 ABC transporter substrate-binding protein [Acidihalobacter yilgarnensis]
MRKSPFILLLGLLTVACSVAQAKPTLTVAYAGSMGVVMDRHIDPNFAQTHDASIHGIGQGAWALARLLAAGQLHADVFVSVTPGPMQLLISEGLVQHAVPVASTQMVIAYSPKSRFAARFAQAAQGKQAWYRILESKGLRFGRTDPATDPQGRNIILSFQLAALYYRQPNLVKTILGPLRNPRQIFTEPSLLSRLESGQIDAVAGYLSAVRSHHLPYIRLPDEINLGEPAYMQSWYNRASFSVQAAGGKTVQVKPQPLVFYAAVLGKARHPRLAHDFVNFLRSPAAQAMFHATGYSPPQGHPLS